MTTPLAHITLITAALLAALLATQIISRVVAQGAAWNIRINNWASRLGLLRTMSGWGTSQDLVGVYRGHNCIIRFVALGAELGSVSPLIQIRVSLDAPEVPIPRHPANDGPTDLVGTPVEPLSVTRGSDWFPTEPRFQELELRLHYQQYGDKLAVYFSSGLMKLLPGYTGPR